MQGKAGFYREQSVYHDIRKPGYTLDDDIYEVCNLLSTQQFFSFIKIIVIRYIF